MEFTPAQTSELFYQAELSYSLAESMRRSGSGSDQADSEIYMSESRVFRAVATGKDLETVLADEDRKWRSYAADQAAKVAAAPKIGRGPSRGHSVIAHRWVNPEMFTAKMSHLRAMVRITQESW